MTTYDFIKGGVGAQGAARGHLHIQPRVTTRVQVGNSGVARSACGRAGVRACGCACVRAYGRVPSMSP